MAQSIKLAGILLTNDLIDRVLKRIRFSHGNPSQALQFFSLAGDRRGFYHTPFSYDTMLYILGRDRRFQDSWTLLQEMRWKDPTLITTRTLQIVLGRIAKVCSVRQTVESFRKFRKLATYFDTPCFNILLSGWKSSQEAEAFFEEMMQLGVDPDLVTYNCMVDVYCKNRELDKARKVFERMRNQEIYPDVITYTCMIGGLGLIGQPDKARDVLKEMREHGCYPDVVAYNATIRNFCIAKRLSDAFDLVEEMSGMGLAPNPMSYNLFFRCFYWANDLVSAWSLYKRMRGEGCLPNTQSCMFLVRLFRRHEKVGMGLELWYDIVENGFGSFTLVSDVLVDLLCDLGKLEEAEMCFYQMIDKGQRPSDASFKRIRVLMQLTNRQESLSKFSGKMTIFGYHVPTEEESVDQVSLPILCKNLFNPLISTR